MRLFEYDSGQLHATRVGAARSADVDPEVMEAVRDSVLHIIGRPLLPIRWIGSDGSHALPDGPHRLIAMDSSGQVVSIEVLAALDSVGLVGALARSGRTANYGWGALSEMYPGGAQAFRRDWSSFRESLPPRPVPGPRLFVVTGSIGDDVRPALEVLADSGVEVYEVSQREMSDGRVVVEINEPFRVTVPTLAASSTLFAGHRPDLIGAGDSDLRRAAATAADGESIAVDLVETPGAVEGAETPAVEPAGYRSGLVADSRLVRLAAEVGQPTPLVWMQLRKGIRIDATLLPDGTIELADGRRFADASEAAREASNRVSVDGWRVWRMTEGGPSLAEAYEECGRPPSSGRRRRRT